ncbi:hypothetical protein [Arthrobacter sp. UM1]|uniref:hypothetical protein n=1 Tax=Arthrobacter sp. UM1 TaxID=2766776 RepID=UPI001CF60FD2|nr:hypothetical protein [Arthrobacter sp. UM1]MCB4209202.1 hypothetical protein [Arthrobacter sp. UM1]
MTVIAGRNPPMNRIMGAMRRLSHFMASSIDFPSSPSTPLREQLENEEDPTEEEAGKNGNCGIRLGGLRLVLIPPCIESEHQNAQRDCPKSHPKWELVESIHFFLLTRKK